LTAVMNRFFPEGGRFINLSIEDAVLGTHGVIAEQACLHKKHLFHGPAPYQGTRGGR
jgi:hypothetical protein